MKGYESDQNMPLTKAYDDVGEVMHLARSGRLIVKLNPASADRVKPGELLIDGSGKRIGRVIELLGPVRTPYASAIPMTDRISRLVGSKVFSGGVAKAPRDHKKRSGRFNPA
jgi:RNA-binding protein